ncbi:hypothetical protein F9817_16655 [Vibrio sp. CAIM 722]|uniref:Integrin alpha beta-propellor repeat protein n=1 Tax=Vibrio eleionomae TaxID=2653505 RepID=A0A7X4RW47_9VIBR|nr:FG-GAP repeat protein [Vibrio eleionomae]MZI94809.1 hypothetical protein [Vibrio eleionomae]
MNFKSKSMYIVPLIFSMALTGCKSESVSLSSFNLSDISASSGNVKTMTLTWTSASDSSGVTYTVCQKDTSQDNDCLALGSVEDSLSTSITVDSLVSALSADYFILATAGENSESSSEASLTADTVTKMIGYIKASDTTAGDDFGDYVRLSDDGHTLAIGADGAGVYLFEYNDGWTQTAHVGTDISVVADIALSGNGSYLAIGTVDDDNDATGVTNGSDVPDNSSTLTKSGAVYVYHDEEATGWTQVAYIKASNPSEGDYFGWSVSLDSDGNTLAVAAQYEDNGATGVITDGSETTDSSTAARSGAVYLFSRTNDSWAQNTYLKASNTGAGGYFGYSVSLSGDGNTLAVGASREDNGATGVITDDSETTDSSTASESGAVYLFNQDGSSWSQTAYIKASNTGAGDYFGVKVALNSDGSTLAVAATNEDNGATGVITDGSETTDSGTATDSGAVYLFTEEDNAWSQIAYIKASNTGEEDGFGSGIAISSDGSTLAISSGLEDNGASGVIIDTSEANGDSGTAENSGTVYLFTEEDNAWSQTAYIKASNTGEGDYFGGIPNSSSTSLDLSSDGDTLVVGALGEDNSATGVITDGSETTDTGTATDSGAVYMY